MVELSGVCVPKDPDLQRTEWEAKLAGLLADKKYWEKKNKLG
jgi:hypothetical protein